MSRAAVPSPLFSSCDGATWNGALLCLRTLLRIRLVSTVQRVVSQAPSGPGLAASRCTVRSGLYKLTKRMNALILLVVSSGIGRGGEAGHWTQQPADIPAPCGSTRVHSSLHAVRAATVQTLRVGMLRGPELPTSDLLAKERITTTDHHSRLAHRSSRILVSATTDTRTAPPSPLIRCCEVSQQRSGAFPRSRSAIKMARILIRKLQRYMYLWRTASASSHLELVPSALALPHYCRNPVQNGFSTILQETGAVCIHDAKQAHERRW
jgi:hypothetical protein